MAQSKRKSRKVSKDRQSLRKIVGIAIGVTLVIMLLMYFSYMRN